MVEELFYKNVAGAVNDVLSTMSGLPALNVGDTYQKGSRGDVSLGDVSVIIGFSGETVNGTFVLHYSKAMAFFLLEKIFGSPATEISEEVLDAVGEVTNMICGKIKTDVVNSGIPEFNITVPTIIVGSDFKTHIKMTDPATIFPFATSDKNQSLNIELKVKRIK